MLVPMVLVNEGNVERSYDIYSRLLKDRIIMISGEVNEAMASVVVSQLLYLQSESKESPIYMYINSPGGSVVDGLAIVDTMNLISCPVYTYCIGQCASMGSIFLVSGEKGHRYALPNSRIMIHQVSGGSQGTYEDMKRSINEAGRLNELLAGILANGTEKSLKEVKKDMDRDYFMSADEAMKYGIVDKVLSSVSDSK
jgi:ATP-dependent Clp protease protease subunit